MKLPDWSPRPDSEHRKASAIALAESVLEAQPKIIPPHVREVLSIAVWKYTECDGKYSTRFRSERSLWAPSSEVHHEHVIPRRLIVDQMLSMKVHPGEVLSTAIGCVVLRTEHHELARVEKQNPALEGWDRYRAAGIAVWDLATNKRVI